MCKNNSSIYIRKCVLSYDTVDILLRPDNELRKFTIAVGLATFSLVLYLAFIILVNQPVKFCQVYPDISS
jgi:hypothetical protein